jgi:cytochrome P450
LRSAKSLLGPILQDLLDRNDRGEWEPANNDAESNVLCWLAEIAKGCDRNGESLAHVEVLLTLASVHTTLLRMVNVLYDVTANPQYAAELRTEIAAQNINWTHATYARLEKMDSVIRESQRMSPPTILGLKRMFSEPFTFDDGTHIPRGTYAAMPIFSIENDPNITPNPEIFDGLRSYRRRHANDDEGRDEAKGAAKREQFQFSSLESTVLHFGYGKTACPGRYFASLVVKMVIVKMLSEFEFRFNEGGTRPKNLLLHEFLFCWPWPWMEVKRRKNSACPF